MRTSDNGDEWAGETTVNGRIFNVGFRMHGDDLAEWELVKSVAIESVERAYVWRSLNGTADGLVRIQTAEFGHWRDAQRRLRTELEMSMRPDVPEGDERYERLGDIVLVADDPESQTPAAISLTRGNVFASVRSVGNDIVDVTTAAESIVRALGEPPSRFDLFSTQVEASPVDLSTERPGEERVVIDNILLVSEGNWLKVLAPDGELRQDAESLIYRAAKPGRRRLEVFIDRPASGRGHAASRTPDLAR